MAEPGRAADLITPEAAAHAKQLEFLARTRVEGFLKGQNWSRRKGVSTEFLQHRAYMPGDDLRRLDWRVFARTDRLVIKEHEEFTNLDAIFALDCSGSMGYAGDGLSKIEFARHCAAMLAYVFNLQNDRFGLAALSHKMTDYMAPSNGKRHMAALFRRLASVPVGDETDMGACARELLRRAPRRSVFILLSDCFQDPQSLAKGVGALRQQGHDALVFHIYDPSETDLTFPGFTLFRDLETGQVDAADPMEIRRAYREVFQAHTEALRDGLASYGVEFYPLPVTEEWDAALARLLQERASR